MSNLNGMIANDAIGGAGERGCSCAGEQLEQERQRAKQLEELLRKAGLDPNMTDRS